jgi:hypothetical protein
VESGRRQILCFAAEQRAVGGEGDVLDIGDQDQLGDEVLNPLAQKRLPAREAQLADPMAHEGTGHPVDLLEAEQCSPGQELVFAVEDLLGHAVRAAEVAPIGDRDT